MAQPLAAPSQSIILVRCLDEDLAASIMAGGGGPLAVMVLEGQPQDRRSALKTTHGRQDAPTLIFQAEKEIQSVEEIDGSLRFISKDGPVGPAFEQLVCSPEALKSNLGQLLHASLQAGFSSFNIHQLSPKEMADWVKREPLRFATTPAGHIIQENGDIVIETKGAPVAVSLTQARNLLDLVNLIKREDESSAGELQSVEKLLVRSCEASAPLELQAGDVRLLRRLCVKYVARRDARRRGMAAQGVTSAQQVSLTNENVRAFKLMGPLVQLIGRSNLDEWTLDESRRPHNRTSSSWQWAAAQETLSRI